MNARTRWFAPLLLLALAAAPARADKYDDAIRAFRNAGESGRFFENSYGYAVFPTIGKGGFGIGGPPGSGRASAHGAQTGGALM